MDACVGGHSHTFGETTKTSQSMSDQHDQDDAVAGFSPAGMVVLVVDDDKLCLKVIAKMLTQCNYEGMLKTLPT